MRKLVLPFLFSLLGAACYGQQEKQVILKLDDVIAGADGQVISERWQRVSDYLEGKNIKAAFGIIGFSLEKDNPAYFKWITDRAGRGLVEFWNHGFWQRTRNDSVGEFERGFDEQLRALRMTDSLAKAKLGLDLPVWGPHWSGTNDDTDRALAQMPQIRITLGAPQPATHFKGIVIPRQISIEHPVHNPDFEAFKKEYLENKHALSLFYLQGHPMSWDDTRWKNFVRIIEFLESEGIRFIKPSEILDK
ncbi:MAG: hypothetical protein ABS46_03740 [Cytophagaceae bacterium SCN 52-12]|nr:MAG: hypothetical protein ABS46_03740 [Cytophagaceae bacterium SCN 52-12]